MQVGWERPLWRWAQTEQSEGICHVNKRVKGFPAKGTASGTPMAGVEITCPRVGGAVQKPRGWSMGHRGQKVRPERVRKYGSFRAFQVTGPCLLGWDTEIGIPTSQGYGAH